MSGHTRGGFVLPLTDLDCNISHGKMKKIGILMILIAFIISITLLILSLFYAKKRVGDTGSVRRPIPPYPSSMSEVDLIFNQVK